MIHEINASPAPAVKCANCNFTLNPDVAEEYDFCCPDCHALVCWICGCTEQHACVATQHNGNRTASTTTTCSWSNMPGTCSFCYWRNAYVLYQLTNGDPIDPAMHTPTREVRIISV